MAKHRMQKGKNNGKPKHKTASRGETSKKNVATYSASHPTLIVGDGNFSFSRGLVTSLGSGSNVTATSYDSLDQVVQKYGSKAQAHIAACEAAGATVMHGVDAGKLQGRFADATFKRIIFNFPHTGQQRVHVNRAMVAAFFASARPLLTRGGEVHVTLKLQPPYSGWGLPQLAQAAGFVHYSTKDFDFAAFPGYLHKTTEADAADLDTGSADARRAIKTLVFRRIAGQPPGAGSAAADAVGAAAVREAAAEAAAASKPCAEREAALRQRGVVLKPPPRIMKSVPVQPRNGKILKAALAGCPEWPGRDAPEVAGATSPVGGQTKADAAAAASPAKDQKTKAKPVLAVGPADNGRLPTKAAIAADAPAKERKAKPDAAARDSKRDAPVDDAAASPAKGSNKKAKRASAAGSPAKKGGGKAKPVDAAAGAAAALPTSSGKHTDKAAVAADAPAKEQKARAEPDASAKDAKRDAKAVEAAASPAKGLIKKAKRASGADDPAKQGNGKAKAGNAAATQAEGPSRDAPAAAAAASSPAHNGKAKAPAGAEASTQPQEAVGQQLQRVQAAGHNTTHSIIAAAVREEVNSSQVEPPQPQAPPAAPAAETHAAAAAGDTTPRQPAGKQAAPPSDQNGQAAAPAPAAKPSPMRKVKEVSAGKLAAQQKRADWVRVKLQVEASKQAPGEDAKQTFLDYLSATWDHQLQNNNPTPWNFMIEEKKARPALAKAAKAVGKGHGKGNGKAKRRQSTGGQAAPAAHKRPRRSE